MEIKHQSKGIERNIRVIQNIVLKVKFAIGCWLQFRQTMFLVVKNGIDKHMQISVSA